MCGCKSVSLGMCGAGGAASIDLPQHHRVLIAVCVCSCAHARVCSRVCVLVHVARG